MCTESRKYKNQCVRFFQKHPLKRHACWGKYFKIYDGQVSTIYMGWEWSRCMLKMAGVVYSVRFALEQNKPGRLFHDPK